VLLGGIGGTEHPIKPLLLLEWTIRVRKNLLSPEPLCKYINMYYSEILVGRLTNPAKDFAPMIRKKTMEFRIAIEPIRLASAWWVMRKGQSVLCWKIVLILSFHDWLSYEVPRRICTRFTSSRGMWNASLFRSLAKQKAKHNPLRGQSITMERPQWMGNGNSDESDNNANTPIAFYLSQNLLVEWGIRLLLIV